MYSIVCLFVLVQVLLQVQQRLSSYQCLPRDRCRPRLHRPVLVRFTLFPPLMLTAFRLPLRQQAKLPRLFPSFLFFNRYSSNNLLWVLNDFLCSPSAKVSASVTLGSEFSWALSFDRLATSASMVSLLSGSASVPPARKISITSSLSDRVSQSTIRSDFLRLHGKHPLPLTLTFPALYDHPVDRSAVLPIPSALIASCPGLLTLKRALSLPSEHPSRSEGAFLGLRNLVRELRSVRSGSGTASSTSL
jgi:hypothetical protein